LLIDVAVPLGLYYLLNAGFGVSVWFSLAISSIIPVIRTVAGLVTERKINTLAALMLVVNVGGIAISFLTGDPRMMIAKDAVISSAVGLGMLFSVAVRRPVMSAALKPFMTHGKANRIATWDRRRRGPHAEDDRHRNRLIRSAIPRPRPTRPVRLPARPAGQV
jgi:hypothetical protein